MCSRHLHRIKMKKALLLPFVLVLVIACAPITDTSIPAPTPAEEVKKEAAAVPAAAINESVELIIIKCEDTDGGNNPNVRGKAIVYYSNGQKESLDDKCPGLNFQTEYVCEGNTPNTVNNKCTNACEKGVCS